MHTACDSFSMKRIKFNPTLAVNNPISFTTKISHPRPVHSQSFSTIFTYHRYPLSTQTYFLAGQIGIIYLASTNEMRIPRQTNLATQPANTVDMKHHVILTQKEVKEETLPLESFYPRTGVDAIYFPRYHQNITHQVTPTRHSVLYGAQQSATATKQDMVNLMTEMRTMTTNLGAMTSEIHELKKDTLAARRQIADLTNEINALKQNLQDTSAYYHGRSLRGQQLHYPPLGDNSGNHFYDAYAETNGFADPSELEVRQNRAVEPAPATYYTHDFVLKHLDPNGMWARKDTAAFELTPSVLEIGPQNTMASTSAQYQQAPEPSVINQSGPCRGHMAPFAPAQHAYDRQGECHIKQEAQAAIPSAKDLGLNAMRGWNDATTLMPAPNMIEAGQQHVTAPPSAQHSANQQVPQPFMFREGPSCEAQMAASSPEQLVYERPIKYYIKQEGQAAYPLSTSGNTGHGGTAPEGGERDSAFDAWGWRRSVFDTYYGTDYPA